MSESSNVSRRALVAVAFNGIVAALLAIPLVGYLFAPLVRSRARAAVAGDDGWLTLGALERFPEGQTRLATFRHPATKPWDGVTANVACWVRNVGGTRFQVFAVNCAHLGCPVRWFPQSRLFMCPCHGGAYYEDGSRASGPPERGLFEYEYTVRSGALYIKPGKTPMPGTSARAAGDRPPCA